MREKDQLRWVLLATLLSMIDGVNNLLTCSPEEIYYGVFNQIYCFSLFR